MKKSIISFDFLSTGSINGSFQTNHDGQLWKAKGTNGYLELRLHKGQIEFETNYQTEAKQRKQILVVEDIPGIDNGRVHYFAITVDEQGTRFYVDGYQQMTGTSSIFLEQIKVTEIYLEKEIDADSFAINAKVISAEEVMWLVPEPEPEIIFGTNEIDSHDAQEVFNWREGTIFTRFRVRGKGQKGTILAAGLNQLSTKQEIQQQETLRVVLENDYLYYQVLVNQEWRSWKLAAGFDDGKLRDLVIRVGQGAVDFYVDGYRQAHLPGALFFKTESQLKANSLEKDSSASILKVCVGQDIYGARIFGEVTKAQIFKQVLNDAQIKRLSNTSPVFTTAVFDRGLQGAASYRIPALVALPSGVLVASADQRVNICNDAPNQINLVIRRSKDQGKTWQSMKTLLSFPGIGKDGVAVTDSCLLFDRHNNRLHCLVDLFPSRLGQPSIEPGVGMDEQGRIILNHQDYPEQKFYWNPSWLQTEKDSQLVSNNISPVFNSVGETTPWHLDEQGNIYEISANDMQISGNVFGVVQNNKIPLSVDRTVFILHLYSDDEGESWSKPRFLNHQVKAPWMTFMGLGPGNGIQITTGKHAGRLIAPVYFSGENSMCFSSSVIYSDDYGMTWKCGAGVIDGKKFADGHYESRTLNTQAASTNECCPVEGENGELLLFMRNQHPSGKVAVARSCTGGESWQSLEYHSDLPEIFSQPNALKIDVCGTSAILFANASQLLPYRGNGVIRVSYDNAKSFPYSHTLNPGHHVYQSMCWLETREELGILWENEVQGIFFSCIDKKFLGLA